MRNTRISRISVQSLAWFNIFATAFASIGAQAPSSNYARYNSFACATIVGRHARVLSRDEVLAGRDRRPDSVATRRARDATRATAEAATRACLAGYSVDKTPENHLIALGNAYLAADDDANADAAFQRALRLGSRKAALLRAWDLNLVVSAYAEDRPGRLKKALAYTAQLDAMGAVAAASRLAAHNTLYGVASNVDSLPFMEAEVRAALNAIRDLRGDERKQWAYALVDAVSNQADLEARKGNGSAAVAIMEQALRDIPPLRPLSIGIAANLGGSLLQYQLYGKPAPAIQSMTAYAPGQPLSTAPIGRPAKGKVSLLVFVDQNSGSLGYPMYNMVRRLMDTYGPRGLEVTLISHTVGWANGQLIKNSAEESAMIRDYFYDFIGLSAPLAIWNSTFTRDPVDESLTPSVPNPNQEAYRRMNPVLVDKAGVIRHTGGSEVRLRHLIEELLGL